MLELLNSFSWTILWFIVVLGIMIFIHELGHHLMAKFLGIRVDVFSLGFGPRLFGFRAGDTEYRVSALPLGGYVKMRGEHYDEDLSGDKDEFLSRPKRHRFAVAVAGPLMNLGLAVLLLAATYMVGIPVPSYLSEPPVVGYVVEESPADRAGIEEGDRVVSMNGDAVSTWEDLQLKVATNPGAQATLQIEREGTELQRVVAIGEDEATATGFLGVMPPAESIIMQVQPDTPAADAGVQSGDVILSVALGDRKAEDYQKILDLIAASEGEPVTFRIRRGEEILEKSIEPVEMDGKARVGIVIGPQPVGEMNLEQYGPLSAIGKSLERNYQMTMLTFDIVGKLITGQTSIKMMSGPIEIAKFSGQAASQGTLALLGFMALISLQLGIFNLFPIPILDGGVIALLAVEGIMGRELSMRVKERIFQVGFLFLILLMSIVIFNDIAKNI